MLEQLQKEFINLMEIKAGLIEFMNNSSEDDPRVEEYYKRFLDLRSDYEEKVHNILKKCKTHKEQELIINTIQAAWNPTQEN